MESETAPDADVHKDPEGKRWKWIVGYIFLFVYAISAWNKVAHPVLLQLAGAILLAALIAVTDELAERGNEFRKFTAALKSALSVQWSLAVFFASIVWAYRTDLPSQLDTFSWIAFVASTLIAVVCTPLRDRLTWLPFIAVAITLVAALIFGISLTEARVIEVNDRVDESEIERVIAQAERYEMLIVYEHPEQYTLKDLPDYWLGVQEGGHFIPKIERAVQNELKERRHYGTGLSGEEASNGFVDSIRIRIFAPGDRAEVQVCETWSIPSYGDNHKKIVRPDLPALLVFRPQITLRKVGGRWRLDDTTGPYHPPGLSNSH